MKNKLVFKKRGGEIIENVREYVSNWMKDNPYGNITIGCDSQEHAKFIKYAVTIVMRFIDENGMSHGGHVIHSTIIDTSKNMKSDIYTKLWAETEITMGVAKLIGDIGLPIKIHLDYNSDESKYSNVLYNAGIGYVKGMGYEAVGKPYAWAASHVADKFAKS